MVQNYDCILNIVKGRLKLYVLGIRDSTNCSKPIRLDAILGINADYYITKNV